MFDYQGSGEGARAKYFSGFPLPYFIVFLNTVASCLFPRTCVEISGIV
jgi:hypothetical protein